MAQVLSHYWAKEHLPAPFDFIKNTGMCVYLFVSVFVCLCICLCVHGDVYESMYVRVHAQLSFSKLDASISYATHAHIQLTVVKVPRKNPACNPLSMNTGINKLILVLKWTLRSETSEYFR